MDTTAQSGRIALEPGYFTVPEDNLEPPRLIGSYSPEAETYFWPRRRRCPLTGSAVTDVELANRGVLYSWTYILVPRMGKLVFSETGGYGVGQVDLPEGPRIQGPLLGEQGDWEIGMPMALTLMPVGTDKEGRSLVTYAFEVAR
ncbi:OB-fold domain-containing protein [Acidiferrimicrobium sp. IK]|uniref:Zn-ribbon domain-containing OB-fold protein n=1 Tax=Acidiferrimicrobium sp. IK TaxID=2871700 RepID=UPI0021CB1A8B|nr:OB-fold domain-containing protein [Acidiferrimicrobium sp. IK]MCU4187463.1 OB-fold domain-containing protein [Acidiferrimicrobium sp. IK]